MAAGGGDPRKPPNFFDGKRQKKDDDAEEDEANDQQPEEDGKDVIVKPDYSMTILISDYGINHRKSGQTMFSDFRTAVADSLVPGLSRKAEIMVPMETWRDYCKLTEQQRKELSRRIAARDH